MGKKNDGIDERVSLNKIRRQINLDDLMRSFRSIDMNNDGSIDF